MKKRRKCGMYYYVYIPYCFKNKLEHLLDKDDIEWYWNQYKNLDD